MTEMKSQRDLEKANEGVVDFSDNIYGHSCGCMGICYPATALDAGNYRIIIGYGYQSVLVSFTRTAVIAYVLLWLSMVLGLLIISCTTRPWPGPGDFQLLHPVYQYSGDGFCGGACLHSDWRIPISTIAFYRY